ncbi:MAG: hypothetical protein NTW95_11995 [Candidatus Aminicenantes bacterium]|nr:hypothetical protein [Candidatus Aminicenantes bacterium]
MKKKASLFIMVLAIACSAAAAEDGAGADSLGLWQKALVVFQKNSDWVPGKMSILSEMLDRKGRPDSITQMVFNIVLDGRGKARTELLQAFKDNKDVSAEMKKKMETSEEPDGKNAKKKDTFTISLADSPFNPDKQHQVTVQATGEKQLLFEKTCRRFDFSFQTEIVQKSKKENLTWVGKAWLDENSGIPVKLEFSFEPLPKHVYSLWTIYMYETTVSGDWYLKEIKVQGHGGFLFIKKGFRSTTNFSEYRRQPQKGDEK